MFDGESDYVVEHYIKPTKIRVPLINDERADILGNFDDSKLKDTYPVDDNPFENTTSDEDDDDDDNEEETGNSLSEDVKKTQSDHIESALSPEQADEKKPKNGALEAVSNDTSSKPLTDAQLTNLLRGASKKDRFVLYVTNLCYGTSKEKLVDFFSVAGIVKSVRVPKTRKNAFAFVEMLDLEGFKNALTLHHRTLDSFKIKIQVSEGGKKKSANKKNILKQKNRKLAEMRNEVKQFSKSGKGYDKKIKREIKQKQLHQERRLAKKRNKKKAV